LKKVIIINCGGNILSLLRAINQFGLTAEVTDDKKIIEKASHIILPGVGAFKKAMDILASKDLVEFLKNTDFKEKKLLGICLGMQILLDSSEEDGPHKGLGLISGVVKKINLRPKDLENNLKIPNIGWHQLKKNLNYHQGILEDINEQDYFYFVHSYYAELENQVNYLLYINYGSVIIPALINKDKIYGCQFHPEKSGKPGLRMLKNFLNI
jgi:glutamine amidotransferase